jgi:hypothetical protein
VVDVPLGWYERGELLVDRETLQEEFLRRKYTPPDGSFLVIAEVVDAAGHPGFRYFSLGDTAFSHSEGRFWPASTVKLMAAVGALVTMSKHGLTGNARVRFEDDVGRYRGTVASLCQNAIVHSNNLAYDRLVRLAGFDDLNEHLFSPENGFPSMTFQCPYFPRMSQTLRTSPEIAYQEGKREGIIEARHSDRVFDDCPDMSNCTTLFELLDGLRRVVLHEELEESDRFPLHKRDVARLKNALLQAKDKVGKGAEKALGHPVLVYNKAGRLPFADHNDHALIVDNVSGRRYLIAVSVADNSGSKPAVEALIHELTAQALRVVKTTRNKGVLMSRSHGTPIDIRVTPDADKRACSISAVATGDVEKLRLWHNRTLIAESAGPSLETGVALTTGKAGVLVAEARRGRRIVGYKIRAIAIR